MVRSRVWIFAVAAALVTAAPAVVRGQAKDDKTDDKTVVKTEIDKGGDGSKLADFKAEQQASKGSVTIGGVAIPYDAYAGTIVVHPKGYDDVVQNRDPNDKSLQAQASMFYVAYLKSDTKGSGAAGDVFVQRRAGIFDGVAAHGGVWAEASGDGG